MVRALPDDGALGKRVSLYLCDSRLEVSSLTSLASAS